MDYDVSTVDQARRRRFYRDLARLKVRLGLQGKMSTASVVFTSDRGLAEEVFKVACQYAKTANLYRASLEVSHVRQPEPLLPRSHLKKSMVS